MSLFLRSFLLVFFVAALTAMLACAPQTRSIKSEVKAAIDTEHDAKTLSEYQSSENHPDVLFSKWTSDQAGEICAELTKLTPAKLIVFEDQIVAFENRRVLAPCLKELNENIETFYQEQRKTLKQKVNPYDVKASGNRFQFPDNVQYRDISHGYTAVRGDLARKEVVLTFDDGPHPQFTPSILRSLQEVNAKAIFFEMGKNVKSYPDMTKLVAAGGHAIGAHSMTHGCLAQNTMCDNHNYQGHINGGRAFSEDQAMAEISGSLQAIYDVLGWVDPYFRFPYGEVSPNLAGRLKENGVANFLWSVDSNDWKARPPQVMIKDTLAQIDRIGGGIVLFHDVHRKTAEAMPEFLSQLYAKGYSVVLLQPQDSKAHQRNALIKSRRGRVDLGSKH